MCYYIHYIDKMSLRPHGMASRAVVWRPWFNAFSLTSNLSQACLEKSTILKKSAERETCNSRNAEHLTSIPPHFKSPP